MFTQRAAKRDSIELNGSTRSAGVDSRDQRVARCQCPHLVITVIVKVQPREIAGINKIMRSRGCGLPR
jgi:hypothetical protein